MRRLWPLVLVLVAGCATKSSSSATTSAPAPTAPPVSTAPTDPPTPRETSTKPANLSAALAIAGLSPCPEVENEGSGFALSTPEAGGGERLHATFHSTEKPDKLAELYAKDGLEQLNKVGQLQLAGKTGNGSDVILLLKPAEGGGTDVEVRAILYK